MTTFTFFLKDGRIVEVTGEDAEEAFRALCSSEGKSWAWMRTEVSATLAPDEHHFTSPPRQASRKKNKQTSCN